MIEKNDLWRTSIAIFTVHVPFFHRSEHFFPFRFSKANICPQPSVMAANEYLFVRNHLWWLRTNICLSATISDGCGQTFVYLQPSVTFADQYLLCPQPSMMAADQHLLRTQPSMMAADQLLRCPQPSMMAADEHLFCPQPSVMAADQHLLCLQPSVMAEDEEKKLSGGGRNFFETLFRSTFSYILASLSIFRFSKICWKLKSYF